jgi:hypothetical protein
MHKNCLDIIAVSISGIALTMSIITGIRNQKEKRKLLKIKNSSNAINIKEILDLGKKLNVVDNKTTNKENIIHDIQILLSVNTLLANNLDSFIGFSDDFDEHIATIKHYINNLENNNYNDEHDLYVCFQKINLNFLLIAYELKIYASKNSKFKGINLANYIDYFRKRHSVFFTLRREQFDLKLKSKKM